MFGSGRSTPEGSLSKNPKNTGGSSLAGEVFVDATENGLSSADDGDMEIMVEGVNQDHDKNEEDSNGIETQWQQTEVSFPNLSEEEIQQINGDIQDEEIKQAVFSMNPWKAPGPDGFPAGQQISQEKTSIMFSKNVSTQLREELVMMSGCNETPSLGKYLGVPLVGRAPKRSDYNYFISQFQIYPMMTSAIPKGSLTEIQKIQRAFIWGDDDGGRRYHAVNWEKVTKPKAYGGLGIRRLVHMNQACLMKLAWYIRSGENALWIKVLKGKYSRGNSNFDQVSFKMQDSSLRKNLVNIWSTLHLYEFWSIGNGNTVKAWEDRWLLPSKSIQELGLTIPEAMRNMSVADLEDNIGCWKIDLLVPWLPASIINRIYAVMPPNSTAAPDQRAWIGNRAGNFSIASA
ncbi:hypothetical protein QL285_039488 [Trifolium repens]|nr:hypothetical protein QL285_039488 [Trifolium repens]